MPANCLLQNWDLMVLANVTTTRKQLVLSNNLHKDDWKLGEKKGLSAILRRARGIVLGCDVYVIKAFPSLVGSLPIR